MKTYKHYTMIRKELKADLKRDLNVLRERLNDDTRDTVAYGYNPLRDNLTESKWIKYQNGDITRKEAVELAFKRGAKKIEKKYNDDIAFLNTVENIKLPTSISADIYWKGYTALCDVHIGGGNYSDNTAYVYNLKGRAGGYGYDKTSACFASAVYKNPAVTKILCEIKERSLRNGKTDTCTGACTGHDNRDVIAYGAGYSVIPYFEGGVGISCHIRILELYGYKVICHYVNDITVINAYKEV